MAFETLRSGVLASLRGNCSTQIGDGRGSGAVWNGRPVVSTRNVCGPHRRWKAASNYLFFVAVVWRGVTVVGLARHRTVCDVLWGFCADRAQICCLILLSDLGS